MLEKNGKGDESEQKIKELIQQLQGPVGKLVLEAWEFPQHLIDVVAESYNFQRQHDGDKDYVDLIQVSLVQGGYTNLQNGASHIPAFAKLNFDPEVNVVEIDENKEVIEETRKSLMN